MNRHQSASSLWRRRFFKEKASIIGFLLFILLAPHSVTPQQLVVYFGDSITEGWIDAELHQDSSFPRITDSLLSTMGVTTVALNKGIGGNTTLDAVRRIGNDVLYQYPDIVVLEFGWNDCLLTNAGVPRVAPGDFRLNIQHLLTLLTESRILTVVIGLNNIDTTRFYKYFEQNDYLYAGGISAHKEVYDHILREEAERYGVPYLPVDFPVQQPARQFHAFDGMHPSEAGHAWIAEHLAPILGELLSSGSEASRFCPLMVYPQPFVIGRHNYLSLRFTSGRNSRSEVAIYNNIGTVVFKQTYASEDAAVVYHYWDGKLPTGNNARPGIYFVTVQTPDRTYYSKFEIH